MSSNQEDTPIPDIIIDKNAKKRYIKGRFFGKGGFAKCYEITEEGNASHKSFAGKIVSKKLLAKNNQKEKMVQEIEIHKSLKHRNVVGFHSFFDDENFVYIVLELCRKRSMMELHRRRKTLTEPEVRYFMKQILEGVLYLHNRGIIHRDLKLGNLFINDDVEVKIGDFGLAAKIEYSGQRKKTLCGTPNYIAPEILNKKGHSFEVDVWSIGCIMYTLLVGKPPFETSTLKETYSRIKRCEYRLPSNIAKRPAGALINAMLQSEPDKRPTIKQILASEFMVEGFLPEQLPASCLTMAPRNDTLFKNIDSPSRRPLKEFNNEHSPVPKVNAWTANTVKLPGVTLTAVSGLVPKSRPGVRQSLPAAGSVPIMPNKTTEECSAHLRSLAQQLQTLLSAHRPSEAKRQPVSLSNLEELTDPAAQPFVWISKWVDYSDKYGFGYQLCDDGVGVMFNDQTRIVLLPNQTDVHYIERTGEEFYYTMNATPPEIEKKMKLLSYFRRYMTDHLIKAGASHARQECDRLTRVPYMQCWKRSSSAVTMQLTNGTIQVNFMDHTKVIVCPLMSAVTIIDDKKNFRTFRLSTLEAYISQPQFQRVAECLHYVYKKIPELMSPQN
ncbi:serine/threonine-protein kinase polo [Macrosteles quadrilineatus]|uniref:serine/threonine-protein kinase polo n=1 Tax=Macrosteles quadrilineatus TaxID=74068 RepID=UPI0023E2FC7B|nr:serine/threonine-protein kinase polo [Macrosteles quadrilineatus]